MYVTMKHKFTVPALPLHYSLAAASEPHSAFAALEYENWTFTTRVSKGSIYCEGPYEHPVAKNYKRVKFHVGVMRLDGEWTRRPHDARVAAVMESCVQRHQHNITGGKEKPIA